MDNKNKESVKKSQLILQWICAGIWLIVIIVDIVCDQMLFLTIIQSVAAVLFMVSAIITTKRYREEHHD